MDQIQNPNSMEDWLHLIVGLGPEHVYLILTNTTTFKKFSYSGSDNSIYHATVSHMKFIEPDLKPIEVNRNFSMDFGLVLYEAISDIYFSAAGRI